MRYRNLKTGAIFDSPCSISGGDWVAEETPKVVKEAVEEFEKVGRIVEKIAEVAKMVEEAKEEETEVDPDGDFNGITIPQIKQELDAMGIKYDQKAKKQELYNLMLGK